MQYGARPGFYQLPPSPPLSPTHCSPTTSMSPPAVARPVPPAPQDRIGMLLAGRLRIDSILGTGAYGVVYAARNIYDNTSYAVKTLSRYNADGSPLDQRQLEFQTREVRLHWEASPHPNVVKMYKIIDEPESDCIYVVLEYCPEGDLFYNITERGQYVGDDLLAKHVFLQLLDAVSYCHSRGIYHRDLKPENVLVTNQGNIVKLADFGLAIQAETSADYGCGSTFYMSPECLEQSSHRSTYYCAPNDIWSLGVILVNLTCGRNPWKQASFEDSTYRAYIREPKFLKTILPVSDELNDILGRIFTPNPARRITMPELVEAIRNCPRFTSTPSGYQAPPTPPSVPVYVPGTSSEATLPQDSPSEVSCISPPSSPLPEHWSGNMSIGPYGQPTPPSSGRCSPEVFHNAPSSPAPSDCSSDEDDMSDSSSDNASDLSLDGIDFLDRSDAPMDMDVMIPKMVPGLHAAPVQVVHPASYLSGPGGCPAQPQKFFTQPHPRQIIPQPSYPRVPVAAPIHTPSPREQILSNCQVLFSRLPTLPNFCHNATSFHPQVGFAVPGY